MQVILLTGCASGIGKYLANQLYQQGHHVVATDVNYEGLQTVAQEEGWAQDKILLESLDVRKVEDWQKVIDKTLQKWGRLEVLMNVAGVIKPGYIHETDWSSIDFHIDINLKGTIIGTKLAAEQMVKQGHGHIINIASLAGISPVKGLNLYCASKFGVRGFSLAVAQELKPLKVNVSVVCPDAINTPMLTLQMDYPEAAITFTQKKLISVEEIGKVILRRAFEQKQLEITYPFQRAFTARLVGLRPSLADWMLDKLTKEGLKKQSEMKNKLKD
jgi:3-oxoacyl-[acyl-carrier protein] reductase